MDEIAETALRFVRHASGGVDAPSRACASVRNVERNVAAVEAGPLSAEQVEVLRKHRWVRNFYR